MADRFPSLEEFDEGQTDVHASEPAGLSLEDRERAALGDDAHLFAADNTTTVVDVDEDDDDDDLLGGGGGGEAHMSGGANGDMDIMGDFETSFPAVDTSNEAVAPGGTITGSTLPYRALDSGSFTPTPYSSEPEPEVLRQWREARDADIERRDAVSAAKKAETIKTAQSAVDEFYENYNNRKDKQVVQTRKEAEEFLKNREDTTSGGTSWERIAKLVDLSGKGVGGGASGTAKARMRELLVDLRKDPKAPGATGY